VEQAVGVIGKLQCLRNVMPSFAKEARVDDKNKRYTKIRNACYLLFFGLFLLSLFLHLTFFSFVNEDSRP